MVKTEDNSADAKMDLMQMTSDLMPAGKADLLGVIQFPMIKLLVEEHGKKNIFKALFLLVKDFCKSLNVVRNMNEDQMLEAANMLIEECGNFRMEDYLMMFQMAKKGQLIKIYDRIDIGVVTEILDKYWDVRNKAGKAAEEANDGIYKSGMQSLSDRTADDPTSAKNLIRQAQLDYLKANKKPYETTDANK